MPVGDTSFHKWSVGQVADRTGLSVSALHFYERVGLISSFRNEFICWVEDAKQQATRDRRIRRTKEELEEGMRRPCCWPGCTHRERTGRAG